MSVYASSMLFQLSYAVMSELNEEWKYVIIYIPNIVNILVYINSAPNYTSSASIVKCVYYVGNTRDHFYLSYYRVNMINTFHNTRRTST